jgi:transcriptional regulator with XRE-family HTH domain
MSKKIKTLGDILKDIREAFALSQVEFAEQAGIPQSVVSFLEAGIRNSVSQETVKRISDVFDVDYEYLSAMNGYPTGNLLDEIQARARDYFNEKLKDKI